MDNRPLKFEEFGMQTAIYVSASQPIMNCKNATVFTCEQVIRLTGLLDQY
jgi:excinuclease UvrABC helicase subunit UvrB